MSSKTDAQGPAQTPGPPKGGHYVLLLAGTFVLAAALRLLGLQSGMWYDEIVTLVLSARHPLRQILTDFPGVNAHPLYSILAHESIAGFGESAWALRLPACIFGTLSVVMAYVLGARVTTRLEAWAGSAVLATSYHHIWFSQNARGYTLLGFLTLLSTYLLLEAIEHGGRRSHVGYALACATGLYTHLTMGFVMAGHVVVVLAAHAGRSRVAGSAHPAPPALPARPAPPALPALMWAWAGATLLAAVAYAPFAPQVMAALSSPEPHEAAQVATARWAAGEAVRSILQGAGVPAALAAGVFAALGAFSLWNRRPLACALLIAPGLMTVIGIAALGQPMRPRFFFILSGAAAIFVGRGIGALTGARPGWVVTSALALVAVAAPSLPRNYRVPKQDFDGAVRFLEVAQAQGAQIAVAGPACLPIADYYAKPWPCLTSAADWHSVDEAGRRALVVYTLPDYVEDPRLLAHLRGECPVVRNFPGTVGGGDMIVCEARGEPR